MDIIILFLLLFGAVCFLLDGFNIVASKWKLTSVGLLAWIATIIINLVQTRWR